MKQFHEIKILLLLPRYWTNCPKALVWKLNGNWQRVGFSCWLESVCSQVVSVESDGSFASNQA